MSVDLVNKQNVFTPFDEAPSSRLDKVEFHSSEATASHNQVSIIRIPHSKNTYIDTSRSYLKFKCAYNITGTGLTSTTLMISPVGAYSYIQSIMVYVGNRLINEFQNAPQIASLLNYGNVAVSNGKNYSLSDGGNPSVGLTNLGNNVPVTTSTGSTNVVGSDSYCIKLLGLLGACDKMLPAGLLNDDISVHIRWTGSTDPFYVRNSSTYLNPTLDTSTSTLAFSEIAYCAKVLTLSEQENEAVKRRCRDDEGIISWSGSNWRCDSILQVDAQTLTSGGKINSILNGFRYKSLKAVAIASYSLDKTDCSNPKTSPMGIQSDADNANAGRLQIAGKYFPQTFLSGLSQTTAETNINFSSTSLVGTNNQLNNSSFWGNFNVTALGQRPVPKTGKSLAISTHPATISVINLEDSDDYLGNAGINTTSVQVAYECDIGAVTSTLPVSTLFFSHHDCIYSINSDGIMSVSW